MPYDDRDAEVAAEIAKLQGALPAAKCGHCGSDKIISNAFVGGEFCVGVMTEPQAYIFKGHESQDATARVCGNCGYIQLFAKNPGALYSAYQQGLKNAPLMKPGA